MTILNTVVHLISPFCHGKAMLSQYPCFLYMFVHWMLIYITFVIVSSFILIVVYIQKKIIMVKLIYVFNTFFQDRIYFRCGQFMAISLVTRGNEFNLMSRGVYQNVCGTELSKIVFDLADIPDDTRPICRAVSAD